MILNVTGVPYYAWNAMQKLAVVHDKVVTHHCYTIEDFEELLDLYPNVPLEGVIVDPQPNNLILNNDICNYVDCPVYTLKFETDVDTGVCYLLEYAASES